MRQIRKEGVRGEQWSTRGRGGGTRLLGGRVRGRLEERVVAGGVL
jgi:hypothetical protein